jgi:acetyl-CoA carboxylase alpha subunit
VCSSDLISGAHRAPLMAMGQVKKTILENLAELEQIPIARLVAERRRKFRHVGEIPGRFPVLE